MSPDCLPIYEQFQWSRRRTLDRAMQKFDSYFEPVRNVIFERSLFNKLIQEEGQSLDDFINAVQTQGDKCEYLLQRKDELIRDRIVVGVRDSKLRQYLIDIEGLDLATCIRQAKQYTTQQLQLKEMDINNERDNNPNMDALYGTCSTRGSATHGAGGHRGRAGRGSRGAGGYRGRGAATRRRGNPQRQQLTEGVNCFYCGKEPHYRSVCPAQNASCHKCKAVGHWACSRACPLRNKTQEELTTSPPEEPYEELQGLFLGDQ